MVSHTSTLAAPPKIAQTDHEIGGDMMRKMAVWGAALLALAGCMQDGAGMAQSDAPRQGCGAPALQGLVGQNKSVLDSMQLPQPVRVVAPGRPVTMDHVPARLNIHINAEGIITRLSCG